MRPRPDEETTACPKCGFKTKKSNTESQTARSAIIQGKKALSSQKSSLKVMDGQSGIEALPTTAIECPKCNNNNAFWWMLQTRSADEPTTQFYRCTKCGHTWRNYS